MNKLKIMPEKYYCGLDVGAQRIKAAILKVKDSDCTQLVGVYEDKIHGFKEGSISDLNEFSECIRKVVGDISHKTGVMLKEVQLGVDGDFIDVRKISTVIPLLDKGNKVIVGRDIRRVNDQAKLLGIKMGEEVLHDLPWSYKVDDVNSAINPLGLCGRKLGVDSLMIVANANRIQNLTKAVNQAGYDIGNFFFSSFAAGDIVLTDRERLEGCILIDIGAHVTSLLMFKDKTLKCLDKILLGGDDFTKNIASRLILPFDLAEEIKRSYAVATYTDQQAEEEILVKRENAYVPIKRETIHQSVQPIVTQLIEKVKSRITSFCATEQINGGITIIGGGALLSGLIERIGLDTNYSVKLGKSVMASQKSLGNAALFASVIGLAHHGFQNTLGYTMRSGGQSNWMKFIGHKISELYQEYF